MPAELRFVFDTNAHEQSQHAAPKPPGIRRGKPALQSGIRAEKKALAASWPTCHSADSHLGLSLLDLGEGHQRLGLAPPSSHLHLRSTAGRNLRLFLVNLAFPKMHQVLWGLGRFRIATAGSR